MPLSCYIITLFAFVFLSATAPPRPHPSETFAGDGYVSVAHRRGFTAGSATLAQDHSVGEALNLIRVSDDGYDMHQILHYDKGTQYILQGRGGNTTCHEVALHGSIPDKWDWIQSARFTYTARYRNFLVDYWQAVTGNILNIIGVESNDATRPTFFFNRRQEQWN